MALEGDLQLRAAIAAQRVEHVAGEALGVDAHQRRFAVCESAHAQRQGFFHGVFEMALETEDPEVSVLRREIRFGHFEEPQRGEIVHACLGEPCSLYYNGFQRRMSESLFSLLVKLGVMASIASILARSSRFKSMLMRENRTLNQRAVFSLVLSIIFALSSEARIQSKGNYYAADLGLEGSLLAGILGGYVTGLMSGILIALPAVFGGQALTLPLLAGVGVLGGLLRDLAPDPEEIWRFSPFPDLNIFRFFKETRNYRGTAFHLLFGAGILVAEFLRSELSDSRFQQRPFGFWQPVEGPRARIHGGALRHHRFRGHHSAEDLEQRAQREEAGGAGAPAGGGPPGGADQPDQPAFSVQYAE